MRKLILISYTIADKIVTYKYNNLEARNALQLFDEFLHFKNIVWQRRNPYYLIAAIVTK